MSRNFTQSFKLHAVEKALNRANDLSIRDIAETLGVGHSTLHSWIVQSRTLNDTGAVMTEKKPQDWNLNDRLHMVIRCGALDKVAVNQHCREHGIYPHHVEQWKRDFVSAPNAKSEAADLKKFKQENVALKKDLQRKNRALAEAAALLVLQKKVKALWGSDEENLP